MMWYVPHRPHVAAQCLIEADVGASRHRLAGLCSLKEATDADSCVHVAASAVALHATCGVFS